MVYVSLINFPPRSDFKHQWSKMCSLTNRPILSTCCCMIGKAVCRGAHTACHSTAKPGANTLLSCRYYIMTHDIELHVAFLLTNTFGTSFLI